MTIWHTRGLAAQLLYRALRAFPFVCLMLLCLVFYYLCTFVAMLVVCVLYISLWSSMTPNIFGCWFMGTAV